MTLTSAPGLAPSRRVLPNGATILAKQTTATPAVAVNLSVRAGIMHEPEAQPGLAHFLSRTIDRGTERRSAGGIAEALDGVGVSLAVGASRHTLTLGCTCLAEDAADLLDLAVDVVRRPTFPEAEVARRRQEIVTGLRQDQDNPAVRAVQALLVALYGPAHPYGRPAKGRIEDLGRLDRAALVDFHRRAVTPGGLTLALVGDLEVARALDLASSLLEDWPAAPPVEVAIAPPPPAARRTIVTPMMSKAQADITYGFATIPRTDPGYDAFWVMNTVLGQYGLGGRLGDNIRERQGMAYYVYSTFEPAFAPAPLVVRAGVDGANVERTITAIDAEIGALARDGATLEEFEDTRRFLVASMPRLLETNAGIADFLQMCELFGLGLDYDVRMPDAVAAVTLDAVREAATCLDPARAIVSVAGPYEPKA